MHLNLEEALVLFYISGWPCLNFRHTSENPDIDVIDHQLHALFQDLKGGTARTYEVSRKLGINRGTAPASVCVIQILSISVTWQWQFYMAHPHYK